MLGPEPAADYWWVAACQQQTLTVHAALPRALCSAMLGLRAAAGLKMAHCLCCESLAAIAMPANENSAIRAMKAVLYYEHSIQDLFTQRQQLAREACSGLAISPVEATSMARLGAFTCSGC